MRGVDGRRYLILANFAEQVFTGRLAALNLPPDPWQELTAADPPAIRSFTLPARQARVWHDGSDR